MYYAVPAVRNEVKVIHGVVRHIRPGDVVVVDGQNLPADVVPGDAVDQFYDPADQPVFVLTPEQLTRCAAVLPIGATADPEAFTKAVASRIVFEGADLSFSTGQRQLLQEKAARAGKTLEQYLIYLRDRFCQDLWGL